MPLGYLRIAIGCIWACSALFALAEESPQSAVSPLRFSGYGTLSWSVDDNDHLAPVRDYSEPVPHGYASRQTLLLDSRIGGQATYLISSKTEAVVQLNVREQLAKGLGPAIELAYLDYQLAPDLKVRVGRVGYNGFLLSDQRNIGYAITWVRPPIDFYGWVPVFSVNGLDATLDLPQGNARWRIRAQAGTTYSQLGLPAPTGETVFNYRMNDLRSLSVMGDAGSWRWKATYSEGHIAHEAAALIPLQADLDQVAAAGIPGVSAEAGNLRQQDTFRDARQRLVTLGAAYDDGTWIGQAELGHLSTTTVITPSGPSGYLVLGRRIEAYTPYVMAAFAKPDKAVLAPVPGNDWSAYGLAELQTTAYAAAALTRVDQTTLSAGVRRDFDHRTALKLQWDHTTIQPYGYGLWVYAPAIYATRSQVNLLTASLDFVF